VVGAKRQLTFHIRFYHITLPMSYNISKLHTQC
jgi:hypothetical protein